MKYFWHLIVAFSVLAAIIFLFFVFSVRVKDDVTFTNEKIVTEPEITIADPSLGPLNAPVTIVNYGDYQCEGCAKIDATLNEIRAEYGDQVRIVWKDMPNSSQHPEAINAAVAARCAGEQKKFWEYHELLMLNQNLLGSELYTAIAEELELRENPFARCLENQDTLPLVERGYNEGIALDVSVTPTLFINNERFAGSISATDLRRAIEAIIE